MSEPLLNNIEYIPQDYSRASDEEAAGPVFAVIATVVSSIGSAITAGAMAVSSVVTTGLGMIGVNGAIGSALSSAIGSGVMGSLVSGGIAVLTGGNVGNAMKSGFVTAGLSSGISAVASSAGSVPISTASTAATGPALLAGKGAIGAAAASGANVAAAVPVSPGIANSIRSMFGNIDPRTMSRIGAALVNAVVNGQSGGQLSNLVAQQRAELEALRVKDTAAYDQRISAAQQILVDAEKSDPAWHARLAMADVAGTEANEFRQAMRNIAVRQGGSLDSGQAKAYERGQSLHTARSKALAYNRRFSEAEVVRNQLRGQGAALLGPNDAAFQNINAQTELAAGEWDAQRQLRESTWGGLGAAIFEPDHDPAPSPDPSGTGNGTPRNEPWNTFATGATAPFGGG